MTEHRAARPGRRPPRGSSARSSTSLLIAASIVMLYPLLWMLSASVRPEAEIFSSRLALARRESASTPTAAAGTACR